MGIKSGPPNPRPPCPPRPKGMAYESCLDFSYFEIEKVNALSDITGWWGGYVRCPFSLEDTEKRFMDIYYATGKYRGRWAYQFTRISQTLVEVRGIKYIEWLLRRRLLDWCKEHYEEMIIDRENGGEIDYNGRHF